MEHNTYLIISTCVKTTRAKINENFKKNKHSVYDCAQSNSVNGTDKNDVCVQVEQVHTEE